AYENLVRLYYRTNRALEADEYYKRALRIMGIGPNSSPEMVPGKPTAGPRPDVSKPKGLPKLPGPLAR
ncbi:MAG: tetratricopeptide repeat protein, partial [Rickettsiales bacterium]